MGALALAPIALAGCPGTCAPSPAPPAAAPGAAPAGSQFVATFETASDFYDRFQLDVHFRDVVSSDGKSVQWGKPMSGDHNMACEGPDTQRTFTVTRANDMPGDNSGDDHRNSQLYWWCAPGGDSAKGHVMTGMGDVDGYTIVSFSPNRSFANASRVCWDVNLTALTGRKWWSVAFVSEAQYRSTGRRLDYVGDPGVDEFALIPGDDSFMFMYIDNNFRVFSNPAGSANYYDPMGVRDEANPFSVSDKAKRYKHCMIDNGNGTVTVQQERANGATYAKTYPGRFPDSGRVIFLDDSYTPGKEEPVHGLTWHWDNIAVS